MTDDVTPTRYRTIWISDVHLGTRDCKAAELLDFLRRHDADVIYLVGDLIDGWVLKHAWWWPQAHNDVVQKLLRRARKGTRVVYVPGNHDEFARGYLGHRFGGIEVVEDTVHETADGKKLWVVHGDRFDPVVTKHRWLVPLVHGFLSLMRRIGLAGAWRLVRPLLGSPYRSLASYVKSRANLAMAALGDFERLAVEETRRRGLDGVVCGHVHVPAMRMLDGIEYLNDGDWVDSCSALVEHDDGRLELLRPNRRPTAARLVRAAGVAVASEA
jgi:UDP-2,3-diacylglucosamine pyrophosphatase LpxH